MPTSAELKKFLSHADAKALATNGPRGLNVIPVSSIFWSDADEVVLIDYFMNKTRQNLLENPQVAFTFWSGFVGYQIKAIAKYDNKSALFHKIKLQAEELFPDRTVHGIVILTDPTYYEASAGIFPTRANK